MTVNLDRAWLVAHPLPTHGPDTDKNSRGRVLAVGGSRTVPGALRLTAEAAFRAGAGKVRLATIESAALSLGVAIPEAGIVALPERAGEIAAESMGILPDQMDHSDTAVIGPGISDNDAASALMQGIAALPESKAGLVIDAACITCAGPLAEALSRRARPLVLTPHHGEMAACLECEEDVISGDSFAAAQRAADAFGAVVVLKASTTVIAAPGAEPILYHGGGVGLATGGSGDVLAGIIAGLLSRGAAPRSAAAWGVWLHGEAGAQLAQRGAPIGFLARELLPEVPRLMAESQDQAPE